MKSFQSQTEMYKSDLHFRVLSELFPSVWDWGLVIVSMSGVYLLEQSFPTCFPSFTAFKQMQPDVVSGLDEGSKHSGNNI